MSRPAGLDDTDATDYLPAVSRTLLELLNQGAAPWQRDRPTGQRFMPFNAITDQNYKAANAIWLLAAGYDDPRWLTADQIPAVSGHIRPGESSTIIQAWMMLEGRAAFNATGKAVAPPPGRKRAAAEPLERPRLRTETLYNAEQIDGLDLPPVPTSETATSQRLAEHLLYVCPARILHTRSDLASYQASSDTICLPQSSLYKSRDAYYADAIIQLCHWTAHPTRLCRDISYPYGSTGHAREELCAVLATMIVASNLGLGHHPGNLTSFCRSWVAALTRDSSEIFRAADAAERIAALLLAYAHSPADDARRSVACQLPNHHHERTSFR